MKAFPIAILSIAMLVPAMMFGAATPAKAQQTATPSKVWVTPYFRAPLRYSDTPGQPRRTSEQSWFDGHILNLGDTAARVDCLFFVKAAGEYDRTTLTVEPGRRKSCRAKNGGWTMFVSTEPVLVYGRVTGAAGHEGRRVTTYPLDCSRSDGQEFACAFYDVSAEDLESAREIIPDVLESLPVGPDNDG